MAAKSRNKTQASKASVSAFLKGIDNPVRQRDAHALLALFKEVTSQPATMWGSSIVGFDRYHYRYDSGREGDAPMAGFSPRKQNLVVYVMPGFKQYGPLLTKLGKHRVSSSCLYINKLADVDGAALRALIECSYRDMRMKYGGESPP